MKLLPPGKNAMYGTWFGAGVGVMGGVCLNSKSESEFVFPRKRVGGGGGWGGGNLSQGIRQ